MVLQRKLSNGWIALDGAPKDYEQERFSIPFDPEALKFVAADLVEESGAKMLLNTLAVDAIVENNVIKGIIIENKSGRQAILADVVIDASGDADIAARAGVPCELFPGAGGSNQPMLLMFRMGGLNYQRMMDYAKKNPGDFARRWGIPPLSFEEAKTGGIAGWFSFVKQAKERGELPKDFQNNVSILGVTPSALRHGIGYIYAVHIVKHNPWDAQDVTHAEVEGRKDVKRFVQFLKGVPGFESSFLIDMAQSIGVRDSRRIIGEYALTIDDLLQSRRFDDDIMLTVDRGPKTRDWVYHLPDGSEGSETHRMAIEETPWSLFVFGVPYRCLIPKNVDGLLVAGKTISMTYAAHARCRSQPECMMFGQAAGAAAAMSAKQGVPPREVDVQALRKKLESQGVNLNGNIINLAKIRSFNRKTGTPFTEL